MFQRKFFLLVPVSFAQPLIFSSNLALTLPFLRTSSADFIARSIISSAAFWAAFPASAISSVFPAAPPTSSAASSAALAASSAALAASSAALAASSAASATSSADFASAFKPSSPRASAASSPSFPLIAAILSASSKFESLILLFLILFAATSNSSLLVAISSALWAILFAIISLNASVFTAFLKTSLASFDKASTMSSTNSLPAPLFRASSVNCLLVLSHIFLILSKLPFFRASSNPSPTILSIRALSTFVNWVLPTFPRPGTISETPPDFFMAHSKASLATFPTAPDSFKRLGSLDFQLLKRKNGSLLFNFSCRIFSL